MLTDTPCRLVIRVPHGSRGQRLLCPPALVALLPVVAFALSLSASAVDVKPFSRDTVLSEQGQPRTVVVAATDRTSHRDMATLAAKAFGKEVQIVDQAEALDLAIEVREELRQQHLLLIGNALDNAAVMRLYHLEKAKADHRYPGRGGWIVRTLVDPWGTGANVIIAAGSDDVGTRQAVQAFVKAVVSTGDRRVLPWGWRFRSGTDSGGRPLYPRRVFSEEDWAAFRNTVIFDDQPIAFYPATAFSAAIQAGREYAETGGTEAVTRFLTAMREVRALGDRIGGMRKMEFRLKHLVNAWELIEADPGISDEQRRNIADYFLFIGTLFEDKYWNNDAAKQTEALCATTNHISNGNLGYLRLGQYLTRRCILTDDDRARAETWMANADMLFDAQDDSYRSGCDANGYQWWTNKHMVMYALWRPDYDLFWNGNMRLLAEILFATADNMGNAAKFGDVSASLTGFSSHAHYLLTHGARTYRDGRHHWISRFLNRGSGDLPLRAPPREPVDLFGIQRVPLSRAIYLHQTVRNEKAGWRAVPWSRAFDKISFRAHADPASPYLLLDGLGGMGHGHDDCNAITRVTAPGGIWLIDAAYDLKTMYDHNGVFVARDGRADAPADLARITAFADLPSFGATRSESPANGLDWKRQILWDKTGWFVVIDDLNCRDQGDYQANAIWRLPVEGRLTDRTLTASQADNIFVIASAGDGRPKVAWEGVQRALGARAFALRQVVSKRMEPGDTITYANLLSWPRQDAPQPEFRRVAPNAWTVQAEGTASLVAVRGGIDGLVETDAAMWRLRGDCLALVHASHCTLAGRDVLRSSSPINTEFHIDGAMVTVAGTQTRIAVPAAGSLLNASGETPVGEDVDLSAGQHRFQIQSPEPWRRLFAQVLAEAGGRDLPAAGDTQPSGAQPASVRWQYRGVRTVTPVRPAGVTSDTPCLQGRSSPVDNLIDGKHNHSTVSAMWPPGVSPTVTFDLGRTAVLDRIEVRSWDGLSDCTLGPIGIAVSMDNRTGSFRHLDAAFGAPRQGERDIARIREVDVDALPARFVRLTFRPGETDHRVYVSEVVFHPDPAAESTLTDINDVEVYDLTGDGSGNVLLAGADGNVHCLDADGRRQWIVETGGIVQDVWAGELDGKTAILAGSEDRHLYRINPDGSLRWRTQTYDYRPRRYEDGGIRCLTVASLRQGEDPLIIVGADNWHLSLFTTAGKEIRHCYFYSHESTFLDVGDLDGDRSLEIFQGSSFAHVNWFDDRAQESHFVWNGIGPAADGVIADLDGNGKGEMIAVGQLGLAASDIDTPVLWRIDTGSPQTCIDHTDLDGDGRPEVVSGGKNGFLWALKAGGHTEWRRNAGDSINDLCIVEHPGSGRQLILTAGDDGAVTVWNHNGKRLATLGLGRQVTRVTVGDLSGDGAPEILATTRDGMLHAVDLAPVLAGGRGG